MTFILNFMNMEIYFLNNLHYSCRARKKIKLHYKIKIINKSNKIYENYHFDNVDISRSLYTDISIH